MEDCDLILDKGATLPFKVDQKLFERLKADRELYFSTLEKEAKDQLAKKPKLEEIEEI